MCMCQHKCGKPNINGEPGYSWNGEGPTIRRPYPPEIEEGDDLLADEPGRCGRSIDAHCRHFRLVRSYGNIIHLLTQHGGGVERIRLSVYHSDTIASILAMSSEDRFWLLSLIYHAHHDAEQETSKKINAAWSQAIVDKRIKKKKRRGRVTVWIEPAAAVAAETR